MHIERGVAKVRVKLDRERCSGHARCAEIEAAFFTLDEAGYSNIETGKVVPPVLEDKVRLGVNACPERALDIDET